MKKLMIAAAVAMLGIAANAAYVSWSTSSAALVLHDGKDAVANSVTMYCWEISSTQFDTYKVLSGEALSKKIYEDFGSKIALTKDEGGPEKTLNTTARGYASGNGATPHNQGDPVYALALLIDNRDGYYLGNVADATIPSSGNGKAPEMGVVYHGAVEGGSVAWAVPEPTSGLLLLLGVAGLALRRRRA